VSPGWRNDMIGPDEAFPESLFETNRWHVIELLSLTGRTPAMLTNISHTHVRLNRWMGTLPSRELVIHVSGAVVHTLLYCVDSMMWSYRSVGRWFGSAYYPKRYTTVRTCRVSKLRDGWELSHRSPILCTVLSACRTVPTYVVGGLNLRIQKDLCAWLMFFTSR
jgi:hypothetical protein